MGFFVCIDVEQGRMAHALQFFREDRDSDGT